MREEPLDMAGKRLRQRCLMHTCMLAVTVVLALSVVVASGAQPVDLVLTPLSAAATPRSVATPNLAATPVRLRADDSGGVSSRLLGQQSAAQATITAYATREAAQASQIATLEAALSAVQVTATALVLVAANTVLDPTRQSFILQTDLDGMLSDDANAVAEARTALTGLLERYPPTCRAGFMLISGSAPSVDEGVALAQRIEALLREVAPTMFTDTTGAELFALPNQPPFGQVGIDIFFYAGCLPAE